MLNVIFYSPLKTKTEELEVLQEDGTLLTTTVTTHYHTVRSLSCNTMTHAKELFKHDLYLESFRGSLPSAQNVELIFSGTPISSLDGGLSTDDDGNEITIPADFSSVTLADGMCKDCTQLLTINIDLRSLVLVKDALMECVSLTSFTGNLGSLQYGDSFFVSCIELNHFEANLDSLVSGRKMFKYTKIPSFSNNLNHLVDGTEMFMNNTELASYTGTLDSIEFGDSMFEACPLLTSLPVEVTLNKLRSGNRMFLGTGMTDVSSFDLKVLESGSEMFSGLAIVSWSKDMPNLQDGINMFENNTALTSFTGSLEKLKDGTSMFNGDRALTTFISNLSSLEKADNMFNSCKLTPLSVMYIVESIKDHGSGNKAITLGINCLDTTLTKEEFAKEAGYNTWQEMHDTLVRKGWTPTWQYNFQ